jgi:hypothetical protein
MGKFSLVSCLGLCLLLVCLSQRGAEDFDDFHNAVVEHNQLDSIPDQVKTNWLDAIRSAKHLLLDPHHNEATKDFYTPEKEQVPVSKALTIVAPYRPSRKERHHGKTGSTSVLHILTPEELQEMQTEYRHARHTPRNGTDISSHARQQEILRCPNQAKCIVPELRLEREFKVYFCKNPKDTGLRFYFLAREGFLMHPGVKMVNTTAEADLLVLVSYSPGGDWSKTECSAPQDAQKLIILNEGDSVASLTVIVPSLPPRPSI